MGKWDGLPWHRLPMLGFDTETTDKDPLKARIVSLSQVWDAGNGTQPNAKTRILRQSEPIPAEATAIHGITDEMAAFQGVEPAEVLHNCALNLSFQWSMGLPVVAFNAVYDLTVLQCELVRYGKPTLTDYRPAHEWLVIDPHVIDKQINHRTGKRTLGATAPLYGYDLAEDAHDAEADTLAALWIARDQPNKEPKLNMPLRELVGLQAGWKAKQAASLEDYFRSIGQNPAEVPQDWPLMREAPRA